MANKLNKNDRELLIFLAEYRLLTVSQIAALCAVGKPAARNRVKKLTAAQLAGQRTPVFGKGRGRPERWVSLTDEGVSLLKAAGGLPGSVASQEVRADTIRCMDHLIELNWFRIHLLHLERIFPQLRLTFLSSESPFLQRCQDGQPFISNKAPAADAGDEPVTFTPDGVFALQDQENGKTLLFLLEVDMGTETLASSHRGVKDIRKKVVNYQQYFRSGSHKRYQDLWHCELNGFRLLFLSNTLARLTALCRLPERTEYRIVVSVGAGATDVPGWQSYKFRPLHIEKEHVIGDHGYGCIGTRLVYRGGGRFS